MPGDHVGVVFQGEVARVEEERDAPRVAGAEPEPDRAAEVLPASR